MEESQQVGQTENTQANEVPSVEVEAREQGWVPKEEFHGDEHKWVPADEFVRRRPLFEKIERQNRDLKEMKRTVSQLAAHHLAVKENAYKTALANLKAEKANAFSEGDPNKIVELDEKIANVRDEQKVFREVQKQRLAEEVQEIHPEFEAWTKRNPWYTDNAGMKAFADAEGLKLHNSGKSREEVLKEVEKLVKDNFPTRFKNPNREKPGAVEGSTSSGKGAKSGYSPTNAERQIAQKFVKAGAFKSEDDYYKELAKLKE